MTCLVGLSYMMLWSRDLAKLYDKLKLLYPHYHTAYGQQTWKGAKSSGLAPTHKVIWPFDQVVLRDDVRNWNYYISITAVPMDTKVHMMLTYLK